MAWFQFGVTTETAVSVQQFTFRQPVITGKRAAIAQAAYESGFDCSDPDKLVCLIDAVVLANNKFGYPDQWDGAAAFKSTLYPVTWTAAHASRKQKINTSGTYQDSTRHPTVPAFGPSAAEIIRNLTAQSRHASGSNRQPLGERGDSSLNKRSAVLPIPGKSAKRIKTKVSGSQHVLLAAQYRTEHRPPPRRASSNIPKPMASHRQRAAQTHQAEAIAIGTDALLNKVTSKLRANLLSINRDREALRARWEIDQRLQLVRITDHLKGLNECFNRAEAAMRKATELLEMNIN